MKVFSKVNFLLILLVIFASVSALQAAPDDRKADLAVSIDDSPDPVTAGNQLTFQITATNLGDPDPDRTSDAKKVEVTIDLPTGFTYVSFAPFTGTAPNSCVDTAGTVLCAYGGNFPVESRVFNVTVDVDPAATGTLQTTASITSDFNHAEDPDLSNNSQTEDTTVNSFADLAVSTTDDPDPVLPGGNVTYTVIVTNNGPSAATTVSMVNTLPAGTTFVSAPGCAHLAGVVTCNEVTIAPGSNATYLITVTAPGTPQVITNSATVSSATTDNAPGDNTDTQDTLVDSIPVADDQSVSVDEDGSLPITTTASDGDNDTLTWILVDGPTNGDLTGTLPDVTYDPDPNFNGSDSFTFKVNDGLADSNTATVSITVDPVNDAPTADDQTVNTTEDNSVAIVATADDIDVGDTLTWEVVDGPANGSLTGTLPNVTYDPNLNFNGTDTFTFKVNDGTADSNTATITIEVAAANDLPTADNQSVSTDEDVNLPIVATASDPDGDSLTWELVAGPTDGILTGTLPNVTYDPDDDFNGSDSFTFKVNDGTGDSNTATISITVDPVNDAPTADDDSYSVDEDGSINEPAISGVLSNDDDVENDTLTAELVTDVSNGTLNLSSDGSFTYSPDADFNGSDSFTYIAKDASDDSNTATVTITVDPVNDNPDAVDDADTTPEDTPVTTDVLANDDDVDGDTLSVTAVTQGTNGSVVNNNDGTVTYTPNGGFFGTDSYTYDISDGNGGTDTATVDITVTEVVPAVDISIGDISVNEPLNGTTTATVTVTLSATSTEDITVDYQTAGNTATADSDYDTTSGQLTITAGNLTGTIDVTVNADATPFEGSETFFVNISNPVNGTILDGQGTVTIMETCLFCDDFENSSLDTTNWIYTPISNSPWSEDGDNLVAATVKKASALAQPGFVPGCQTCMVNVTVSTAGGPRNKIWIFGWYVDKANRMEFLMKEEQNVWLLKQRSGGFVVKKAKTKAFDIVPGVSYDVKINFTGAQFEVSIDGTPAFTMVPVGGVPTGTVGFQVKATTARFGQIIVN